MSRWEGGRAAESAGARERRSYEMADQIDEMMQMGKKRKRKLKETQKGKGEKRKGKGRLHGASNFWVQARL